MQIGQEGDNRPYRRPKKDEYYASKASVESQAKMAKEWPHCSVCGILCDGQTFGTPPDDITCLRCWSE